MSRSKRCLRGALFAGLLQVSLAGALDVSDIRLTVGGYVDGGRFQLADTGKTGEFLNRVGAKWDVEAPINENWSASADIHWFFWRNQATDKALFHIAGQKFNSDMQASIQYRNGAHAVKFGLFDFKYNPDSKNLGEYLLRSEAYPTLLESAQGKDLLAYSDIRVAGVQYGLQTDYFRPSFLLFAEQFNEPVNDISAAAFMTVGPERAELSLGAECARFIKLGDSIYLQSGFPDSLNKYAKENSLTTQAWKFILRGRLDFGALLGMEDNFKLYGEAALLGLKNDTLYYKHVQERMPMMAGVDLPTLGILNTLSFEGEYFPNPYYEKKYQLQENKFTPLPSFIQESEYSAQNLPNTSVHDWRWSVFLHKALNPWLHLKLRAASDHMRLLNWSGDYEGGTPFTRRTKDWYLLARVEFHN